MSTTLLLEKDEMARVLERLASQILERHAACEEVMLVGIERRGADLARRLAALLQTRLGHTVPLGTLDINLYRDDWTSLVGKPSIGQSRITESVDEKVIILVDDVLYTGRTIRAALEAVADSAGVRFLAPPLVLCTDNAAMIAWAGIERFRLGLPTEADLIARPRWPLDATAPAMLGSGKKGAKA